MPFCSNNDVLHYGWFLCLIELKHIRRYLDDNQIVMEPSSNEIIFVRNKYWQAMYPYRLHSFSYIFWSLWRLDAFRAVRTTICLNLLRTERHLCHCSVITVLKSKSIALSGETIWFIYSIGDHAVQINEKGRLQHVPCRQYWIITTFIEERGLSSRFIYHCPL